MATSKAACGRDAILLLKDVFDIKQDGVRSIDIHAPYDDIATITVNGVLRANDIDITSEKIDKDTTHESVTYEVTIKKVST